MINTKNSDNQQHQSLGITSGSKDYATSSVVDYNFSQPLQFESIFLCTPLVTRLTYHASPPRTGIGRTGAFKPWMNLVKVIQWSPSVAALLEVHMNSWWHGWRCFDAFCRGCQVKDMNKCIYRDEESNFRSPLCGSPSFPIGEKQIGIVLPSSSTNKPPSCQRNESRGTSKWGIQCEAISQNPKHLHISKSRRFDFKESNFRIINNP